MKFFLRALMLVVLNCSLLEGTPSSVFWTVCTTDVYSTGTGHIDADNYFTVFNRRGEGSSFSPDIGFEFGVFSFGDFSAETGVDYLGGTDYPLFFNAGIAVAEDKLFEHAPSLKVGIFDAGSRYRGHNRTNQNIVDIIIGKSLPDWLGGRFCLGGFSGSRAMGKNRQGLFPINVLFILLRIVKAKSTLNGFFVPIMHLERTLSAVGALGFIIILIRILAFLPDLYGSTRKKLMEIGNGLFKSTSVFLSLM